MRFYSVFAVLTVLLILTGCQTTTDGDQYQDKLACDCSLREQSLSDSPTPVSLTSARVPEDHEPQPEKVRFDLSSAVQKINAFRQSNGRSAVRIDPLLMRIAAAHADDLASFDRVSHHGSNGSTLETRLKLGGYDPVRASENLSAGQRDFDEAFLAWQNSPSHRSKLLADNVSEMGFGFIYKPDTEYKTFWALVIAEPF